MRNGSDRTSPRFTLETPLPGQANGTEPLAILNVSRGGAMIEHRSMIRPGTIIHLRLPVERGERILRSRVAWSSLAAFAPSPSGARHLVYRSGLEFLDAAEGVVQSLMARLGADCSVAGELLAVAAGQ